MALAQAKDEDEANAARIYRSYVATLSAYQAVDFDDLRVKVIQIVLPVLSLWPEVIDYALPYKGAHFLMLRAMNDGPADFDVAYEGETMKITRTFDRKKATSETDATYMLKINACNPGC